MSKTTSRDGGVSGSDWRLSALRVSVRYEDELGAVIDKAENFLVCYMIELDSTEQVSDIGGDGEYFDPHLTEGKCTEVGMQYARQSVFDRCREGVEPESALWILTSRHLQRLNLKQEMITAIPLAGTRIPERLNMAVDCLSNSTLIVASGSAVYAIDPCTKESPSPRAQLLAGLPDQICSVNGSGEIARFGWLRGLAVVEWERCVYVTQVKCLQIRRVTLPLTLFQS